MFLPTIHHIALSHKGIDRSDFAPQTPASLPVTLARVSAIRSSGRTQAALVV